MKSSRITSILTLFVIFQFAACSKSKKETGVSRDATTHQRSLKVIEGGEVCAKVLALDQKYKPLFKKSPADIEKYPAEMEKIKTMLSDMDKLASDYPNFSCILSEDGEQYVYNRETHVAMVVGLKKQFNLKKSM